MKKSAVFILLGQSNAAGHGNPMKEADIINIPLKNVYGLSRAKNQSFDSNKLIWEHYTSYGMNLAQELDNTYSLANQMAIEWQKCADNKILTDYENLYIVQIAIGSQGVTKKYMWYPDRQQKLICGKLGTVDISLYPFTIHILSMLEDSLKREDFEIIGVHWRGGEEDANEDHFMLEDELLPIYERIVEKINSVLHNPPVVLHRLCCPDWMIECDPSGKRNENMEYINSVFYDLEKQFSNVTVFDTREYPKYEENIRGNGLFLEDAVHYTADVNKWVAECIIGNL